MRCLDGRKGTGLWGKINYGMGKSTGPVPFITGFSKEKTPSPSLIAQKDEGVFEGNGSPPLGGIQPLQFDD